MHCRSSLCLPLIQSVCLILQVLSPSDWVGGILVPSSLLHYLPPLLPVKIFPRNACGLPKLHTGLHLPCQSPPRDLPRPHSLSACSAKTWPPSCFTLPCSMCKDPRPKTYSNNYLEVRLLSCNDPHDAHRPHLRMAF